MPSASLLRSETISFKKTGVVIVVNELTDDEYLFIRHCSNSPLKFRIVSILNKKKHLPVIQNMIDKKM
jgi:hypothetical protein